MTARAIEGCDIEPGLPPPPHPLSSKATSTSKPTGRRVFIEIVLDLVPCEGLVAVFPWTSQIPALKLSNEYSSPNFIAGRTFGPKAVLFNSAGGQPHPAATEVLASTLGTLLVQAVLS